MKSFNPYLVCELVTQSNENNDLFGLIGGSESNQTELHGYEITMSGRLVLPELTPQPEQEAQKALSC